MTDLIRVEGASKKFSNGGVVFEDVFLIDGPALAQPKAQLQLERDLLEALSP